jgi:diacylglycerol O-acyltransferase-1
MTKEAQTLASKKKALQKQVNELQKQLKASQDEVQKLRDGTTTTTNKGSRKQQCNAKKGNHSKNGNHSIIRAPSPQQPSTLSLSGGAVGTKRGYLFKWMDRAIGWGGTKWSLRFVTLEHGRLSYYLTHTDTAPRYALNLRGCAVQDDGWKKNRRHWSSTGSKLDPPLDEPGAYFFVFSVYLRDTGTEEEDDGEYSDGKSQETTTTTTSSEVVPLLRFSTPSMAEKAQWIMLLSEACAYCETDAFLEDESAREADMALQQQQQRHMAQAMPEAKEGTLPPLIFAEAKPITMHLNRHLHPSSNRLPLAAGAGTDGTTTTFKKKTNLFLTKSSEADVDKKDARSTMGYPPSKPMHRAAAPSYLSVEADRQNFRGFLNLGVLILIVSNFRLLLDTVRKNGFIVTKFMVPAKQDLFEFCASLLRGDPLVEQFPLISGGLLMFGSVLLSLGIEWLLSRQKLKNSVGMILHHINTHASFIASAAIVWNLIESPIVGHLLLFHSTITWMKLVSYTHANEDYRLASSAAAAISKDHHSKSSSSSSAATKKTNKSNTKMPTTPQLAKSTSSPLLLLMIENLDASNAHISYPENVTFANMMYFWVAPTLTYQIAFPSMMYPRVRWFKVFGLVTRIVIVIALISFLAAQVVNPTLEDLIEDLEKANGTYTASILADYWLKLTIASTYLWLLIFYGYFHLYLNLLAELLQFGDRVFYKDWWNSSTASSFWRLWNMPVHYWMVRHVYFPCLRFKTLRLGRSGATLVVFLLSAIIHEVEVSIPFHMVRPWTFLGMMAQIPLVYITKLVDQRYRGSSIGNIIFWISFCVVGQPMAVLLYTIDYKYRMLEAEAAEGILPIENNNVFQDHLLNECRIRWGNRCIIQ